MTTLITGGAGFVGLALAEQLRGQGKAVTLVDLPARGGEHRLAPPPGCRVVAGDLREAETLDRLFADGDIEHVVHAAAITPSPERERDDAASILDVNVVATAKLMQRCAQAPRMKRVVLVSSVAVYGFAAPAASGCYDEAASVPAPAGLYGISKLAAEQAALRIGELHDLDVRIARLGPVFGRWEQASGARQLTSPHHQVACLARAGEAIVLPRPMAADWIYAPDAAQAIARLLLHDAELQHAVYHVGGGGVTDVEQWCLALAQHLPGLRSRIAAPGEPANVRYSLPVDRAALDTTRLATELKYRCGFDLSRAAADYMQWCAAMQAEAASSSEVPDAAA
ncbi:MAG TPA: NAD(P)-dependent oxidoreductase [Pararobbsia sp.]|nr:NAD(P)-dependent oxidoreductase [Pararobbsia sp.]